MQYGAGARPLVGGKGGAAGKCRGQHSLVRFPSHQWAVQAPAAWAVGRWVPTPTADMLTLGQCHLSTGPGDGGQRGPQPALLPHWGPDSASLQAGHLCTLTRPRVALDAGHQYTHPQGQVQPCPEWGGALLEPAALTSLHGVDGANTAGTPWVNDDRGP